MTVRTKEQMYKMKRDMLSFIRKTPGATSTDIQNRFGGVPETNMWHLRVMAEQGILKRKKAGTLPSGQRVYTYSTTRESFKKLEEEYSTSRRQQEVRQIDMMAEARKRDAKAKKIKTTVTHASTVTNGVVHVSAATIKIEMQDQVHTMDIKTARELKEKLAKALGE